MSQKSIHLEGLEGFHIGGTLRSLSGFGPDRRFANDGHHMVGQMYAQHFKVAAPCTQTPIALWHGGGLTGASWETTPDGRSGWLHYFLREGFSTYLCDAYERGRSSLPPPPAVAEIPEYRSLDSIWHHFRFGERATADDEILRQPRIAAYAGQQFPVESLFEFGKQFVPRFVNSDDETLAAYAAFLERARRCHVVAHSQGGAFAVRSAVAHKQRIRSVVALEPSLTQECIARLESDIDARTPPHLFIFGDYIRGGNKTWQQFLDNAVHYCEMLRKHGVPCQILELPAIGIQGNSHMLQMDCNSDHIASLVKDWLIEQEASQ